MFSHVRHCWIQGHWTNLEVISESRILYPLACQSSISPQSKTAELILNLIYLAEKTCAKRAATVLNNPVPGILPNNQERWTVTEEKGLNIITTPRELKSLPLRAAPRDYLGDFFSMTLFTAKSLSSPAPNLQLPAPEQRNLCFTSLLAQAFLLTIIYALLKLLTPPLTPFFCSLWREYLNISHLTFSLKTWN